MSKEKAVAVAVEPYIICLREPSRCCFISKVNFALYHRRSSRSAQSTACGK
ncbi:hypothetical protein M5D96_011835 [Drosophila gunungcola]|uniref:Uncharacterized protein n=1 Tax=Drosophila gunungcola TaxID=103775 RepID=A0A9Q0BKD4_9MUSC|nr:hypothetical protein M5D96_011835 [Drosophila gunungcola]